jgi:hypothetical protein
MKIGDMIKFKSTGFTALIINIYQGGHHNRNSYVELYVKDGVPNKQHTTTMSIESVKRAAEVINESR